jgi:hypothetical protein
MGGKTASVFTPTPTLPRQGGGARCPRSSAALLALQALANRWGKLSPEGEGTAGLTLKQRHRRTTRRDSAMADVKWAFTADYVETCNCTYGCPCNFSGFPTDNKCEALVGYHIRQGHYGHVRLDGLDCIFAGAWPNAIHEGHGTATLFVAEQAAPEQRHALVEILTGRAGGEGPFAVFSGTITTWHEPRFVPIEFVVAGPQSRFVVPGYLEVALEAFTNPVTGAPNYPKLELESAFIWKVAHAAKTKIMKIFGGGLTFDHSGQNAFHTVVEFHEV